MKLSTHLLSETSGFTSLKGSSAVGISFISLLLMLAVLMHSNGGYIATGMSRWTYSWINLCVVLGRNRRLLVRPYHVNNQLNTKNENKILYTFIIYAVINWKLDVRLNVTVTASQISRIGKLHARKANKVIINVNPVEFVAEMKYLGWSILFRNVFLII